MFIYLVDTSTGRLHCKTWENSCRNFALHCNTTMTTNSSTNSTNLTLSSNSSSDDAAKPWRDCCELARHGKNATSGVYKIHSGQFSHMLAYCDIKNNDGWRVIMRRQDNSLSFNRSWEDYADGFGTLTGEFWYGLDKINILTSKFDTELLIELTTSTGSILTVNYSNFRVRGPEQNYKLEVKPLRDDKGNLKLLSAFDNHQFTTYDKYNTQGSGSTNCALSFHSGWWYTSNCEGQESLNLNGKYNKSEGSLEWFTGGDWKYIKTIVMKIRKKTCLTLEQNLTT